MIRGFDRIFFGGGADIAGELAAVGAESHYGEAEFFLCNPGGGERVGGVAEDKNAFAREISGIDRARIPRQP